MVSFAQKNALVSFRFALDQYQMQLSKLDLIQRSLHLQEEINHFLESSLFDLLWDVVLVVAMSVRLLPHGVGEQKGHLKLHLFDQFQSLS